MQRGQRVDKYVLEEKLGEGGMAEVWKGRHVDLDKVVAIKCLSSRLSADPEFERRFLNEGRRQARLRHPHIVPVLDFISTGGGKYLVMEYVEGESLEALEKRARGPLPLDRAAAIAMEIASALDHAHRQGLVHRDVKPSNILLDGDGRAWLTDFGIALMAGEQRITRGGVAVGTVHYMSPEQISRPRELDHRSDLYSFGCVLFEVFTGRPPFLAGDSDTDFTVMAGHLSRQPPRLRDLNPAVPEAVEQVVLRCLAKDPAERFPSAGDIGRALRHIFHPGATTGQITAPVAAPAAGRDPWVLAGVAVLAVVLGIAGAYYLLHRGVVPPGAPPRPVTPAPAASTPVPVPPPPPAAAPVVTPRAAPLPAPVKEAPPPARKEPRKPPEAPQPAPSPEERKLRACRALGISEQECVKRIRQEADNRMKSCLALGLSEEECAQRLK